MANEQRLTWVGPGNNQAAGMVAKHEILAPERLK